MLRRHKAKVYASYRRGIEAAKKDSTRWGTFRNIEHDTSYDTGQFWYGYEYDRKAIDAYHRVFEKYLEKYLSSLSPEERKRRMYNGLTAEEQTAYNTKILVKSLSTNTLTVEALNASIITTSRIDVKGQ